MIGLPRASIAFSILISAPMPASAPAWVCSRGNSFAKIASRTGPLSCSSTEPKKRRKPESRMPSRWALKLAYMTQIRLSWPRFSSTARLLRSHQARCSSSKTIMLPFGVMFGPCGPLVATRHGWPSSQAFRIRVLMVSESMESPQDSIAIAFGWGGWQLHSKSVLPGVDAEANDGLLPQCLGGLQPMQAFDKHKACAVRPHQNWRLLAVGEHTVRYLLDAFGIKRSPPLDGHVNGVDREGLSFHHDTGKGSTSSDGHPLLSGLFLHRCCSYMCGNAWEIVCNVRAACGGHSASPRKGRSTAPDQGWARPCQRRIRLVALDRPGRMDRRPPVVPRLGSWPEGHRFP